MIAGVTAIITIFRGDVVVVGVKPHRTVAHARIKTQLLSELPLCLQVGIDVPHQVAFVAAQIAFLSVLRRGAIHHEVFIAATLLAHIFVVQTGREGDRDQQFATVGPAGIDALIVTIEVDHAACVGRFKLRLARNRLILRGLTLTGIHHHAQIVLFTELTLVAQACLGLFYAFAHVVLFAARRLFAVLVQFAVIQPAGIVGLNIDTVKQQGQLADIIDSNAEFGVGEVFTRRAVVAIAAGDESIR